MMLAKVKHIYSTGVIDDRQNIFIIQATGDISKLVAHIGVMREEP
jgi:hypothetical protein